MLQFLLPTAVSVSGLVAAVLSRRDRETQPVTAGCIHVKDCHVIIDGWWGVAAYLLRVKPISC